MNLLKISNDAQKLFSEASFISKITTEDEHQQALELIEILIDDYENNEPLIDLVSHTIEEYEKISPIFSEFNRKVAQMNNGVAVLKVIMEQYELGTNDFQDEIGGKSLVSLITNNKRQLTLGHIHALAKRFNLNPKSFV